MVGPCVTVACFVGDVSEIDKNGALPLPLALAIAIAIVIVVIVIDIDEVEDCSAVEE